MYQPDIRLAGGYLVFQLNMSGAPSSLAGSTSISAPDVIRYGTGQKLISKAFQSNADLIHIRTSQAPVEFANSMSFVERYYNPIRCAYNEVQLEAPQLDLEAAMKTNVKSINDSVGPNGLVPTLLVYGAPPRLGLPNEQPYSSMFQRANALKKATAAMTKHITPRQTRDS